MLREELQLLHEQGSYVGEVVKPIDKKKVLVKVHPEGKFVVDIDKAIKIEDVSWSYLYEFTPNYESLQVFYSYPGRPGGRLNMPQEIHSSLILLAVLDPHGNRTILSAGWN